jgi:SPP1 family predicted phage head-tail adaptor
MNTFIPAGKLNRRISIQSQSTSQDSFGQPLTTWGTVLQTWASIDIQGSQLLYATAEFISKVAYRMTIRWTPNVVISADQRVVYIDSLGTTHTYEIEAVLNDQAANRQITLMCYELNGAS